MSSAREAYERAVKLYNAGDLEGLVNCYTEDATVYTNPPPIGSSQIRQ
jgi:ketosteroid isomerase-like protein